jgi:hypothetical protein
MYSQIMASRDTSGREARMLPVSVFRFETSDMITRMMAEVRIFSR